MATICLKEYRCQECKKLLFKGALVESVIELRCKNCHYMNNIESSTFNELLCAVYPCAHRLTVEEIANKTPH